MNKTLKVGAAALQLFGTTQTGLSHAGSAGVGERKYFPITETHNPKVHEQIQGLTPEAIESLCAPLKKDAAKALSLLFGMPGTPAAIDIACDVKDRTPPADMASAINEVRKFLLAQGRIGLSFEEAVPGVASIIHQHGITLSPEQAEHLRTYLEQITKQGGVTISPETFAPMVDHSLGTLPSSPTQDSWETGIQTIPSR